MKVKVIEAFSDKQTGANREVGDLFDWLLFGLAGWDLVAAVRHCGCVSSVSLYLGIKSLRFSVLGCARAGLWRGYGVRRSLCVNQSV